MKANVAVLGPTKREAQIVTLTGFSSPYYYRPERGCTCETPLDLVKEKDWIEEIFVRWFESSLHGMCTQAGKPRFTMANAWHSCNEEDMTFRTLSIFQIGDTITLRTGHKSVIGRLSNQQSGPPNWKQAGGVAGIRTTSWLQTQGIRRGSSINAFNNRAVPFRYRVRAFLLFLTQSHISCNDWTIHFIVFSHLLPLLFKAVVLARNRGWSPVHSIWSDTYDLCVLKTHMINR